MTRTLDLAAATIAGLAATACTSGAQRVADPRAPSTAPTRRSPSTTAAPTDQSSTTVMAETFQSVVSPIDPVTAARLTASWRPGRPVPLDELRLVTLTTGGSTAAPARHIRMAARRMPDLALRSSRRSGVRVTIEVAASRLGGSAPEASTGRVRHGLTYAKWTALAAIYDSVSCIGSRIRRLLCPVASRPLAGLAGW